jgi:MoxR-like ATPase
VDEVSVERDVVAAAERAIERLAAVRTQIGRVIFGQEEVVDETLTGLLAGGHVLLVGVPGLAKTRLAETLGTVLGLAEKRIQFTPDLLPPHILGNEVIETDERGQIYRRFIKGPIFAQLLMADEINRASPRTQAALLQAMQERKVTIAGEDHLLPRPFHVLATQNPIEQEGTYPLPEAQLDRFLLQVNVSYPSEVAERRMMIATTSGAEDRAAAVLDGQELMGMQDLVRHMPVGERIVDAILKLVRAGRPELKALPEVAEYISWGPGPRASQALMLVVRVRALLDGRLAPSLEDLRAMAGPTLRHRMAVTFAARAEGITVDNVVERLVRHVA